MLRHRLIGMRPQTVAEKRAASTGISLFFGALIGANLGSIQGIGIRDYALLVAVLCLIVLYLHLIPTARDRWSNAAHLLALVGGLYVLLIHDAGSSLFDGPRPTPHIFTTICFWLASVAVIELRPTSSGDAVDQAGPE